MKKFSIVFYLVLIISLVACDQETQGNSVTPGPGNQPQADGSGSKELAPEQIAEAEKLARETALTALKDKITTYKKKMADEKEAHGKIGTSKNEVDISDELTGFTKDTDSARIHASLGYDNELIGKLNNLIMGLSTGGSIPAEEIKKVTNAFNMLIELDDTTNKILDEHLKAENLAKIEKDKAKIDTATRELNAFIASRDAFIASIKKSIEAVLANNSTADDAKAELKKIADQTKTNAKAGESGYYHSTVKAIEKNEKALAELVK
ncbi:hypothetical protein [Borrelia sp. P9F1]|uniref:hypothetical protein n=1 Tax=Borrelia sp. P9F1 TaxID=3058374 RepID=UPI002647F635|nr:hypothetical protein [Borrelia sp. P9F1]WKC58681.1 hypothetical protein QYZ68_05615 [Borrelia sp. P9F1]